MGEVYAVCLNKGGVGKTSLLTNICGVLAREHNKKVLIIDTDGQGNSSLAFGKPPESFDYTIYDVITGNKKTIDVIEKIDKNLHILPSNSDMNKLELDVLPFLKGKDRFTLFYEIIAEVEDDYDYIFIDTPPSLGLTVKNVLAVADKLLLPFVPVLFTLNSLLRTIDEIKEFAEVNNPSLEIAGIVPMQVKTKMSPEHSKILQDARNYLNNIDVSIFETAIRKSDVVYDKSIRKQKVPAVWAKKLQQHETKAIADYYDLVKELLENDK